MACIWIDKKQKNCILYHRCLFKSILLISHTFGELCFVVICCRMLLIHDNGTWDVYICVTLYIIHNDNIHYTLHCYFSVINLHVIDNIIPKKLTIAVLPTNSTNFNQAMF